MFEEEFLKTLKNHSADHTQHTALWNEVKKNYSASSRHYHTLTHLDNLLKELTPYRTQFVHWDTLVFAIAYHDIVYNTLKSNNEEKSAQLAVRRLTSISFPKEQTTHCKNLIIATKHHEASDHEINLFTDADLSILGADSNIYKGYAAQIRREYFLYPDLIYLPGRKKVLNHFLQMKRIYKTDDFAGAYERQARINLQKELETLG